MWQRTSVAEGLHAQAVTKLGRARASGTNDIHKPYGLDTKHVLRLYPLHVSNHKSCEIVMRETIHKNTMEVSCMCGEAFDAKY